MNPNGDVSLTMNGFDANSKFAEFAKTLIDDLHRLAPSDATTRASFTKLESQTSGSIQISSIHGTFSAQAQGRNAREVAYRVTREIREQLSAWKKNRWHRIAPEKSTA